MSDFYASLELSNSATADEIRTSYRKLVLLYHPDRNKDDDAILKFREVQEAYDCLSDPTKRASYDNGTYRRKPNSSPRPKPTPKKPPNSTWKDYFHDDNSKGKTVQVKLELNLEEIVKDVDKTIKVPNKIPCEKCESRGFTEWAACPSCAGSGKSFLNKLPYNLFQTCSTCRGSGRSGTIKCEVCQGGSFVEAGERSVNVKIAAGVETGARIKVPGEGDPSRLGKPGDLEVVVTVKEHAVYTRKGCDLHVDLSLSYSDLILGKDTKFKALDESEITLTIPPNTSPGTVFKMKKLGLVDWSKKIGDILATIDLKMPQNTSEEYKALLIKLKELENN